MLNSVKEIIYTVGDSTGAFAKSIGLSSAEIAKTVGTKTVTLAKDIGPKRALIGAAILAVAVGGSIMLVRYLRRRDQANLDAESMAASDAAAADRKNTKIGRAESRAVNAALSNAR